jgi:hypothetical protein
MTEVLTGLAIEEFGEIEGEIHSFLRKGKADKKEILETLHRSVKKGGIGMPSSKAHKLAKEIGEIVKEIEKIKHVPAKVKKKSDEDSISLTMLEARALRRIILHTMDIELTGPIAVKAFDAVIQKRLEGKIDRQKVRELLDLSIRKGGVGLGSRQARMVSKRIELLVMTPAKQEIPTEAIHEDE